MKNVKYYKISKKGLKMSEESVDHIHKEERIKKVFDNLKENDMDDN